MDNKSLEFVKNRIKSGVCNGMESNNYTSMQEVDFMRIVKNFQFNKIVKVTDNSWETELEFEAELKKKMKIKVSHNPNAEFDYFTTESCRCDGTYIFKMGLCGEILKKMLSGQSYYAPKLPKDFDEKDYDITLEVGNFVFADEYGEEFSEKNKPWMKSKFTAMLPIKCEFFWRE